MAGDRPVTVVGLFQQSSMKGRGTVGFVADPVVALPLRTQADHQMLLVVGPSVVVSRAFPCATAPAPRGTGAGRGGGPLHGRVDESGHA